MIYICIFLHLNRYNADSSCAVSKASFRYNTSEKLQKNDLQVIVKVFMYTHICIRICKHSYSYIYIYIYIYIYMCLYEHICIHIRIYIRSIARVNAT
jgi:hypothetical protein